MLYDNCDDIVDVVDDMLMISLMLYDNFDDNVDCVVDAIFW